jgi:hypothetical protein
VIFLLTIAVKSFLYLLQIQVGVLSGAENFFESHDGRPERSKERLKPIALVRLPDKPQERRLGENP